MFARFALLTVGAAGADLVPPELLGPYGLVVALLIAVGILWRDHVAGDRRRDALLDVATAGWREQTDASKTAASGVEQAATAITKLTTLIPKPAALPRRPRGS